MCPEWPEYPEWLDALTVTSFFGPCPCHEGYHATDRLVQQTFLNMQSSRPVCSMCVVENCLPDECLMRVRRCTYRDVIKVADVAHLVDVSKIQPYIINGEPVLFLKPRPQAKQMRVTSPSVWGSACGSCRRTLMDCGMSYCSLRCKLVCEKVTVSGSSAGSPVAKTASLVGRKRPRKTCPSRAPAV